MTLLRKFFLLGVILLLFSDNLWAGRASSSHMRDSWAIGLWFGATSFYGDLADFSGGLNNTPFSKYFYRDVRTMQGVSLEKWFNSYFGLKGHMMYGQIQGTKETSSAWFESNIFNYNLSVMLDVSNLLFSVQRSRPFSIYVYTGMGLTESRTWKYSLGTKEIIGTNGFGVPKTIGGPYVPMTETIVPVGLGFKYYVSSSISLMIDASFNVINSDKLDATPNKNSSYIAGLEGYNYFALGIDFWLPQRKGKLFKGRGGAQYRAKRGSYVNPRIFRRNDDRIFKNGRSRFKFKRR